MDEIWKDISGFEGSYQVSNLGRVRSLTRQVFNPAHGGSYTTVSRVLRLRKDKDGYLLVTLSLDGARFTKKVHRLAGDAFIPNPDDKPEINHKDGVRSRNIPDNLEWNTRPENLLHSFKELGRKPNRAVKVKAQKGEKVIFFKSILDVEQLGFKRNSVYACLTGEYSHHHGYVWSYDNG